MIYNINKKIGIITYHRAINYGAILQAYALQTKINDLGAQSEIIDYRNRKLEKEYSRKTLTNCKTFKDLVRFLLLHKDYNIKYDKFRNFIIENIDLTTPIYSIEEIKKYENKYDFFITGSDQVWNYKLNDKDSAYFLSFVNDNSKKKSYAASFGFGEIPKKHKKIYKDLLTGFDTILVREKQGARIIRDLLSKEASVVFDPTMLLSKEQWLTQLCLEKNQSCIKDKYILVYAFNGSTNIKDLALNISKRTGYKIVWISTTYKYGLKIKYIKAAGPKEFISLFNDAEYILTNSFHGTVFSINFNKEFFTELLPESIGANSRLEDILELFELQDRRIISSSPDVIDCKIDYDKVNLKLEEEKEKSISFLNNAIGNYES